MSKHYQKNISKKFLTVAHSIKSQTVCKLLLRKYRLCFITYNVIALCWFMKLNSHIESISNIWKIRRKKNYFHCRILSKKSWRIFFCVSSIYKHTHSPPADEQSIFLILSFVVLLSQWSVAEEGEWEAWKEKFYFFGMFFFIFPSFFCSFSSR